MRASTKARISAASVSASSLTPLQQHGLAEHRDASVDEARAGGARRWGQLARMVGVHGDVDGLAAAL